jgi:hypothetical protein
MKQPNWIKRMEAIDHHSPGYWVDRGCSEKTVPQTTSLSDAVSVDGENPAAGVVLMGGIAYSGGCGIRKVKVQLNERSLSIRVIYN